jgi:hypothetical protein
VRRVFSLSTKAIVRIPTLHPVITWLLLGITVIAVPPAAAQGVVWKPWTWPARNTSWHFATAPYYDPVTAQPHAPRVFLLIPAFSDAFPHSEKGGRRFAWQITLGRDIPIWGVESESRGINTTQFTKGNWGFGIWTPVSFHMVEDFKDESAPIVDTDYRFGASAKLAYGLTDNTSLNVKFTPWAHESTHLGDEYTIVASRRPTFERVNVSYEYREYGVSITQVTGNGSITVRHGGISLWGSDGYYSNHLLGETTPTLTPSAHNYEPSFAAEWYVPRNGLSPLQTVRARQWVLSGDLRFRLQYNYHQSPPGDDHRRPSLSLSIGRAVMAGNSTALKQYFFYVYRGVNPYGQLRVQNGYTAAGLGWIFQ